MGPYCTVSEISSDFGRKLQIFPNPVYLVPRLELGMALGLNKTRREELPRPRYTTAAAAALAVQNE